MFQPYWVPSGAKRCPQGPHWGANGVLNDSQRPSHGPHWISSGPKWPPKVPILGPREHQVFPKVTPRSNLKHWDQIWEAFGCPSGPQISLKVTFWHLFLCNFQCTCRRLINGLILFEIIKSLRQSASSPKTFMSYKSLTRYENMTNF